MRPKSRHRRVIDRRGVGGGGAMSYPTLYECVLRPVSAFTACLLLSFVAIILRPFFSRFSIVLSFRLRALFRWLEHKREIYTPLTDDVFTLLGQGFEQNMYTFNILCIYVYSIRRPSQHTVESSRFCSMLCLIVLITIITRPTVSQLVVSSTAFEEGWFYSCITRVRGANELVPYGTVC